MKRGLSIVAPLLLFILLTGFNLHKILTRYDEEIDGGLRKEMRGISLALFERVRSGGDDLKEDLFADDLPEIQASFHKNKSELLELFNSYEFELFDEYYSKIERTGSVEHFTIVPMDERSLIVQKIRVPTDSSYMQFWKSNNDGFQYLVFLQYVNYGGVWKLLNFSAGDYAIQGLSSPDLIGKCVDLRSEGKPIASAIYALAARKVMRPVSFLQYRKESDYIEIIDEALNDVGKKYALPISLGNGSDAELFAVDLEVTASGISPVLKYLTSKDISRGSAVSEEAATLLPKISAMFPDLEGSFDHVILQAFNEFPRDPEKVYACHNTIFKNGKRI
jgi:hypothetical protein